MVPREHPQGTTILVLGILGFFVGICAPFAWYLGSKALTEIRASGVSYSNEQTIVVGRILGIIVTILAILSVVFVIIVIIIIITTSVGLS
ncbi:MAG: DUF4190 domain-containing protein [Propionibacteriaceae bacterium]|nr:DUF4190 domain-containing protein [Propionibacteriaceae bacterium]